MDNTMVFQVGCHLVHGLLHGGEVPRILRLMAVIDHLKNVPLLGKQRNGVRECPNGFRCAGKEQQRLFLLLSVLQNLHGSHLRNAVKPL